MFGKSAMLFSRGLTQAKYCGLWGLQQYSPALWSIPASMGVYPSVRLFKKGIKPAISLKCWGAIKTHPGPCKIKFPDVISSRNWLWWHIPLYHRQFVRCWKEAWNNQECYKNQSHGDGASGHIPAFGMWDRSWWPPGYLVPTALKQHTRAWCRASADSRPAPSLKLLLPASAHVFAWDAVLPVWNEPPLTKEPESENADIRLQLN